MGAFEDAFREAIATSVEEDASDQLEHAARTVAASRPAEASITSVRTVEPDEVPALRELASELARRYGLKVTFEERTTISIRFSQ